MAEIRFPQWRAEQRDNNYPFADSATLTNGSQTIPHGTFLDLVAYPIGGRERMYLSQIIVTDAAVEIVLGDIINPDLARGTFSLLDTPSAFKLTDSYDRPAGVVVSKPLLMAALATFGVGEYTFTVEQTELVADVCCPTPELGVRGVQLADGTLLTGDIWLVGGDGVVLQHGQVLKRAFLCSASDLTQEVITVHVVGDPLFRRRLCSTTELFATPRFIQTITFTDKYQSFTCTPDQFGDIRITVNNDAAADTVLRVRAVPGGLIIEAVGEELEGLRNL